MTASLASVSHALHGVTHRARPDADRARPFANVLQAAQDGTAQARGPKDAPARPGAFLASKLLEAMQAIR